MGIFDFINNILYKDKFVCAICGEVFEKNDDYDEIITGHVGICLECIGSLHLTDVSLKYYCKHDMQTEIFAPTFYKGEMKRLIADFKFNGIRENASVLAYIICRRFEGLHDGFAEKFDMIVPVPLSEKRMAERGYNQSALIAEKVGKYFGMEYHPEALVRVKNTKKQSLAENEKARFENVRNAFRADESIVNGKRVLIFDDIYTYGYTAAECISALKAAGAVKTGVLVAALAQNGSSIVL